MVTSSRLASKKKLLVPQKISARKGGIHPSKAYSRNSSYAENLVKNEHQRLWQKTYRPQTWMILVWKAEVAAKRVVRETSTLWNWSIRLQAHLSSGKTSTRLSKIRCQKTIKKRKFHPNCPKKANSVIWNQKMRQLNTVQASISRNSSLL